jgi:hypothetical protein
MSCIVHVKTQTTLFGLKQANEALDKFGNGEINGVAVLVIG